MEGLALQDEERIAPDGHRCPEGIARPTVHVEDTIRRVILRGIGNPAQDKAIPVAQEDAALPPGQPVACRGHRGIPRGNGTRDKLSDEGIEAPAPYEAALGPAPVDDKRVEVLEDDDRRGNRQPGAKVDDAPDLGLTEEQEGAPADPDKPRIPAAVRVREDAGAVGRGIGRSPSRFVVPIVGGTVGEVPRGIPGPCRGKQALARPIHPILHPHVLGRGGKPGLHQGRGTHIHASPSQVPVFCNGKRVRVLILAGDSH